MNILKWFRRLTFRKIVEADNLKWPKHSFKTTLSGGPHDSTVITLDHISGVIHIPRSGVIHIPRLRAGAYATPDDGPKFAVSIYENVDGIYTYVGEKE